MQLGFLSAGLIAQPKPQSVAFVKYVVVVFWTHSQGAVAGLATDVEALLAAGS